MNHYDIDAWYARREDHEATMRRLRYLREVAELRQELREARLAASRLTRDLEDAQDYNGEAYTQGVADGVRLGLAR